jgi:hypothetical protein
VVLPADILEQESASELIGKVTALREIMIGGVRGEHRNAISHEHLVIQADSKLSSVRHNERLSAATVETTHLATFVQRTI